MRSYRAARALHRSMCSMVRVRPTGERLIVVLDTDECLIHSVDFSMEPEEGFRQEEDRPDTILTETDKFRLVMEDGASCEVHKRPGVDDFLVACAAEFDTYVF